MSTIQEEVQKVVNKSLDRGVEIGKAQGRVEFAHNIVENIVKKNWSLMDVIIYCKAAISVEVEEIKKSIT